MDIVKTPLDLPIELFLEIMTYITEKDDLKNFAHFSKPAYRITFQTRFRGVTIDSKNIILFKDENIFWQVLPFIESVKFAKPWCAKHIAGANERVHDLYDALIEFMGKLIIPNIESRLTALQYFPAITSLSLSYYTPSPLEKNIFVLILKRISEYPFFKNLKHLDLIVSHIGNRWCGGDSFERIMSHQSPESRELLGPELNEKDVEKFIEDMQTENNLFVSLEYAKISIHEVSSPHEIDDSYPPDNAQLYYRLLTLAPNLEELEIESIKRCEYGCDHYVRLQNPNFTAPAPWFQSQTLKRLSILKDTPFTPLEITTIAEIFPNIDILRLDCDYKTPRHLPELDFENVYDPILLFKKLKAVFLPRPDPKVCKKWFGFELQEWATKLFPDGPRRQSGVDDEEVCSYDLSKELDSDGQVLRRPRIDFFYA
ncbi:hypothetical protein TWF506_006136 [Arthrobotrys conoides]|uniref:F-box domain-containing protein n=1 Tax=Arthrobotrys conoides TaxID=74498 RepID=A0AAN8RTW8_9PEZI